MSNKVNILKIISGHIETLRDSNTKLSLSDIVTFFLVPLFFVGAAIAFNIKIDKDFNALLVNFGAIFTALLLSVLVLVYDQESKLQQPNSSTPVWVVEMKRKLLKELYFNICFAVIVSLILVLVCFFHSLVGLNNESISRYGTTPVAIYLTANLFLTIFMVVKRMHVLLTVQ